MEWLVVLFFVVALITVLGHGIWLLLATILRALFAEFWGPNVRCRHCGRITGVQSGRCRWCGQALSSPPVDESSDLAAVARQLRRWQAGGALPPRTVERLLARIEAYRQSLTRPSPVRSEPPTVEPRRAELAPPSPVTSTPRATPQPRTVPKAAPKLPPWMAEPAAAAVTQPPPVTQPPTPAPSPAAPSRPRRAWAEVLSTFMEERNIRWGELVGGLLIVGSSVALVISIWEQLKAIPYFQFFVFVAVSAALFGIGLYSHHRWKLHSTSQGLLMIATLLVPLNFAAMVATRRGGFDPLALLTELAALAVFLALVYRAGRVLVAEASWWLTISVVGISGMLLLLMGRPTPAWSLAVGLAAAALQATCTGAVLYATRKEQSATAAAAARAFVVTGAAAFALAVVLTMAAVRSADRLTATHALAPVVALAGVPIMLCGMFVMARLAMADEHAGWRTAGTAVAIAGAALLIAALGLAWPMPLSLAAVGLFDFAAISAIALRSRLPLLHALAAACLAIGYVVVCQVAAGHVAMMAADNSAAIVRSFVDGQTGSWLVGLVAVLAAMAAGLDRRRYAADAVCYLAASAVLAAISICLVTWPVLSGGGDHAGRAAAAYGGCALVALLVNARLGQPRVGFAATLLLCGAALFGTTAWLLDQPWVEHDPAKLVARQSLQSYAIALATLSLVRTLLSIVGRKWPPLTTALAGVFGRVMLRLVVAASFFLAIWHAAPGVIAEYSGGATITGSETGIDWLLFAVGALALAIALWDGWHDDDLTAAILLSISAPVVAATSLSPAWATASALRWGLAGMLALSAGLMWFRRSLTKTGLRLGWRLHTSASAPLLAQYLWLATTVLPVVGLSMLAALMQIGGHPPAGPLAGTWFSQLGMTASHLVPLATVALSLTCYAVRERSPGYAFAGGIVLNMTFAGGYALAVRNFGAVEFVRLVQGVTIVAAVWASGWLACRQLLISQAGFRPGRLSRHLLRLQVAQSAAGNALLVLAAVAVLFVLGSPQLPGPIDQFVAAVGSPWGWLALVASVVAGGHRLRIFNERLRPDLIGLIGMAALSLAACSVELVVPHTPWAYRALLLGWAMYALSVVAATWWAAIAYRGPQTDGPPRALVRGAALWVRVAGLAAVALGIKTVAVEGVSDTQTLWAAAAIGIASFACAVMAVWLRREGWAFTAGFGVQLAASLAVAHLSLADAHRRQIWLLLWQANVIAGAAVALIWLAARRRMYRGRPLSPATSPLLTLEVAGVGTAALGLIAVAALLVFVRVADDGLLSQRLTAPCGWFAWLFASAAVAVYLHGAARRTVVDGLAISLLGAGVLLAAARLPTDAALAYSTVVRAWLATGALLLTSGWWASRWQAREDRPARPFSEWLAALLNSRHIEAWVALIPLFAAAVAVRGTLHHAQWGFQLGTSLAAAAALPGALAIWLRKRHHLYSSGILLHLAASLVWYAGPQPLWADLVLANALAAAITAIVWSLRRLLFGALAETGRRTGNGVGDTAASADTTWKGLPPVEHTATVLAVMLLATVGVWSWGAAVFDSPPDATGWLTWLSLATVLLASTLSLCDQRAAFGWAGIYSLGLAAIALALVAYGWRGEELVRVTMLALAGWVFASALTGLASNISAIRSRLRLGAVSAVSGWFSAAQACFGVLAVGMGLWVAFDFVLPRDRLAAPVGSALLLAAALAMARRSLGSGSWWRVGALALVALLTAEVGWSYLSDGDRGLLWIHRGVVLLASLAAVVAGCELAASKRRGAKLAAHDGSALAQKASPALRFIKRCAAIRVFLPLAIALLLVVLGAVLGKEVDYRLAMPRPADGTWPQLPMALAAKLAVLAVIVQLIVLALRYALHGRRDPLRLTPSGRTAYVYAAELLVLLIPLHLRITLPKLLPFGILENWWTLVVMIVAFCGAGLSELFDRRQLRVLAEPLRRTALAAPLLPVIALGIYLLWRPTDVAAWIFRARWVDDEAVFFLVAVFYGLQGWLRRSYGLWACSALAGNAGFWLLWHRLDFEFLVHPQLWLIPPALAALAAEYVNHSRLSRQQSDAVRYLALSIIYVSSTADVFISHAGREISLPLVLVLMGLSVVGILAGMLLQVRSFLYLGVSFLLVDLCIMVYHAAWDLGHTWVFWATNIAVGAAILVLFAVFEKRRNEAARQESDAAKETVIDGRTE